MSRRALALAWGAVALPILPMWAQVPVSRYVDGARQQIDSLNPDSASSLLTYALDPRTGAGIADRLRGYVLLGVVQLMRQRRPEARQAMRAALALDPELKVDSLAFLQSDLLSTFDAERAALVREQGLSLVMEVATDTLVPVQSGGYRVLVLPTRRSRLTLQVFGDSGGLALYSDSQVTGGVTTFDWNLRALGGQAIEPGRYTLRVTARDTAARGTASSVERTLTIDREVVDTLALPPPIGERAFAAESVQVRRRSRPSLWRGLAFGVASAALAYVGTGPSGVKDGRAFLVGGTVTLGGIVGLLSGTMVTRASPDGIDYNRHLRQQDADNRAAIVAANARAHQRARIRIRASGNPQ